MSDSEIYRGTASGKRFYIFEPSPEMVDINDIAHHLSTIGRWGGATTSHTQTPTSVFDTDISDKYYYSVAEHSIYVAMDLIRKGKENLAMEGLLHDAAEAYMGDIIRPIKYSDALRKPLKEIEHGIEYAVSQKFGLAWNLGWPEEVMKSDNAVLKTESKYLMTQMGDWLTGVTEPPSEFVPVCMEPEVAKRAFLNVYNRLKYRNAELKCPNCGVAYQEVEGARGFQLDFMSEFKMRHPRDSDCFMKNTIMHTTNHFEEYEKMAEKWL